MYQLYPDSQTQLPETQRQPAPAAVLTAVKAMYAGAATGLVGLGTPVALGVRLWAVLVWLVGLTAVVFLWRRDSSAYFQQAPA
jgi:hypothetical protein